MASLPADVALMLTPGVAAMDPQVVSYRVDESTVVRFEVEPTADFRAAGPDQIAGRVREAVEPAVEAAKAVLDKLKEIGPDQVELKFGIKVSGGANWLFARAATEGNFEITLSWSPGTHAGGKPGDGEK
jgi:hypothetical protein